MVKRNTNKQPHYDLAIIGAGTAGLTAAIAAIQLGVRVALIEGDRTGGECTWTGCIPSKALLAAARMVHQAREAGRYGVEVKGIEVDFAAVMDYVHNTIQQVYHEETPEKLRAQGIDVYEAYAHFTDSHTLCLSDGRPLCAKHILLCTGAKAIVPDAFRHAPYFTSETLFDLKRRPEHLIIVGDGPVAAEMAQAFRRLGSQVTIVSRSPRLLPDDEEEASVLIMDVLRHEGMTLILNSAADSASGTAGNLTIGLENGSTVQGDVLLIAVGKHPNFQNLNLQAAGVETHNGRLILDDRLRTSQSHIFAAGDVTGGPQFTHYAGWQAVQAVRNALLPFSAKGVKPTVPWATFTDPEVAHAGLTEAQARQLYRDKIQITRLPMSRADRAMTEGKPEGFMKLVHKPNGCLLGATIVGFNAGELINDWTAVLEKGGRVWDAADAMRVYPTLGTANVILATEQIRKQLASGFLGQLLRGLARLSR